MFILGGSLGRCVVIKGFVVEMLGVRGMVPLSRSAAKADRSAAMLSGLRLGASGQVSAGEAHCRYATVLISLYERLTRFVVVLASVGRVQIGAGALEMRRRSLFGSQRRAAARIASGRCTAASATDRQAVDLLVEQDHVALAVDDCVYVRLTHLSNGFERREAVRVKVRVQLLEPDRVQPFFYF